MELSYNILLYIQNTFCIQVAKDIYGDMATHLYDKWLKMDNNILNFISCLDHTNRSLLFRWGKKSYNDV